MADILFMNFFGYDLIIWIFMIITVYMYAKCKKCANILHEEMQPFFYIPVKNELSDEVTEIPIETIVKMREKSTKNYSIFTNMIAVFPLLGILGTVYSLLKLVSDSSDVTGSFYGALTSTFWGIVFAIFFKLLDSALTAPLMEENEKDVERFLDSKSSQEKAKK